MKRLFCIVAALVVYGSLYPCVFDFSRVGGTAPWLLLNLWPRGFDRFLARDVTLNVLLYIPVGMSAFLMLARRVPGRAAATLAILISGTLSAAMEILQVYVPGRVPSVPDIVCNVIGGAAGALIALRSHAAIEERLHYGNSVESRPAALLLAAWAVAQWYPFFPALNQHQLHSALLALWQGPVAPLDVWTDAAEWLAAALALRALNGPLRPRWLLAALAWAAGRLLIGGRTVTASEVAGAAVALLLWLVIRDGARLRAAAWLLGLALAASELSPFHFSSHAAPFSWAPFHGAFNADRQFAIVVMARKAFDYGAEIWLLRRTGMAPLRSALAVSAALLLFENIQRYLPGRTAEIADPVIALLMSIGLRRRKEIGHEQRQPQHAAAP